MDPDSLVSGDASPGDATILDPSRAVLQPLSSATQPTPTPVQRPIQLASIRQPVDLSAEEQPNLASPRPVQLAQAAPPAQQFPGQGQGLFGSNILPVPRVVPQGADPLDLEINNLTAQRDQFQRWGSDPQTLLWERGKANAYIQKSTELSAQIQQKQIEKQTQDTNQTMARNAGLTRVMPRTADAAAIREEMVREWKDEGNYDAYRSLVGAQDARGDLYMSEGINAMGGQVSKVAELYKKLDNAGDNAQYQSQRKEVLQDAGGTYNKYGLTDSQLPKTRDEFTARRAEIMGKFNNAKLFVATYNQKQAELTQASPITDEKVAGPTAGRFTFSNSDVMPKTTAVTLPELGGAKGVEHSTPGSKDLAKRGSGPGQWNTMDKAIREDVQKTLATPEFQGAISKHKMATDFLHTINDPNVFNYPAGVAMVVDEAGGVFRDVAEKSQAAGTVGISKQIDLKYGSIDNALNAMANNGAAYLAWIRSGRKGEEVKLEPRLTPESIEGFKYIAKLHYDQTAANISRLKGPIDILGMHGGDLANVGLNEEAQKILQPFLDQATLRGTLDYDKYDALVKGDRRISLAPGTIVPAGTPGFIPAGSYAKTLRSIPVTPPADPQGAPGGAGGSPPPGTQSLTPPGGGGGGGAGGGNPAATPYAAGIRAGESGNRYNAPPGAKSTASGAYQFTDSTWNANKPPGAPDQAYKATPEQQDVAFNSFTAKNAAALTKAGVPVTPLNLAITHQQGEGGGPKLLKAPDDALAKDQVGRTEAANNAQFFWDKETGRALTVAESKAKFAQFYRQAGGVATLAQQALERRNAPVVAPAQPAATGLLDPRAARQAIQQRATQVGAPQALVSAITPGMAVAGGAMGTAVGGPLGAIPGAMTGGAIGRNVTDYMTKPPEEQDILKSSIYGAGEGLVAGIPGGKAASIGARMALGATVPAAERWWEGDTLPEVMNAAAGGLVGGALGESLGATLGMAKHLIWTGFSKATQGLLTSAAEVIAKEQPKIADATGKMVPNAKYEAAEQFIKNKGMDPEGLAYGFKQVEQQVSRGQAFAERPGGVEQLKQGRQLENIKNQVADAGAAAGVGGLTPKGPIPSGPISTIRAPANLSGNIPQEYLPYAQHAESALLRPTRSVGEHWSNAADAREYLLRVERSALSGSSPDTIKAQAMRDIADNVRQYQEIIARALLPKAQSDALIGHLKDTDQAYRKAVLAGGDNIVETIAAGGKKGNQARTAFNELARNDPVAKSWMNALVGAQTKGTRAILWTTVAGLSGTAAAVVPIAGPAIGAVGGAISVVKGLGVIKDYMVQKGAGKVVTMKNMMGRQVISDQAATRFRQAGAALGSAMGAAAAQRAVAPSGNTAPAQLAPQ